MRPLLLALLALVVSAEAATAQRLVTTRLACDRIQSIVRQEGGIVMYWQSRRVQGLPRYERLVRDSYFCESADSAQTFYVPAADTEECIVKRCQPRISDDDGFFRRRR